MSFGSLASMDIQGSAVATIQQRYWPRNKLFVCHQDARQVFAIRHPFREESPARDLESHSVSPLQIVSPLPQGKAVPNPPPPPPTSRT